MSLFGHLEPALTAQLFWTEKLPHPITENLCPPTGQGFNPSFFESQQYLGHRQPFMLRQVGNLHSGEGFDRDLRPHFFDRPDKVQVVS